MEAGKPLMRIFAPRPGHGHGGVPKKGPVFQFPVKLSQT